MPFSRLLRLRVGLPAVDADHRWRPAWLRGMPTLPATASFSASMRRSPRALPCHQLPLPRHRLLPSQWLLNRRQRLLAPPCLCCRLRLPPSGRGSRKLSQPRSLRLIQGWPPLWFKRTCRLRLRNRWTHGRANTPRLAGNQTHACARSSRIGCVARGRRRWMNS